MAFNEARQSDKGHGRGIAPLGHLAVYAKPEHEQRPVAMPNGLHQELGHFVAQL